MDCPDDQMCVIEKVACRAQPCPAPKAICKASKSPWHVPLPCIALCALTQPQVGPRDHICAWILHRWRLQTHNAIMCFCCNLFSNVHLLLWVDIQRCSNITPSTELQHKTFLCIVTRFSLIYQSVHVHVRPRMTFGHAWNSDTCDL